jgi:hypothetical protein
VSEELRDLERRMANAERTLAQMADAAVATDDERLRLKGKAAGVRLARSYVIEAIRLASTPRTDQGDDVSEDERWCPLCEVDLGLHGEGVTADSVEPFDCEIAARKESLLRAFPFGARG